MNRLVLLVAIGSAVAGCSKNEVKTMADMAGATTLVEIPKTELYSGQMDYPGIPPCHENAPDDDFAHANEVGTGVALLSLEICPVGDQDFFHVTVSGGYCAKVTANYPISFGDLDLAIYDSNKMATAWYDGDATYDNACVIIPAQARDAEYYAVVAGAANKAVNRYALKVTEEPASDAGSGCSLQCPVGPLPPDMARPASDM